MNVCGPPSHEDIRAALKEMRSYVDVTEEDLVKIYEIALHHARARAATRVAVREIMSKNVITIKRDALLQDAARLLSENRISGMPVVDDNNHVVGILSEADILILAGMKREHTFKDVIRNLLKEQVPAQATSTDKVEKVMSFPPITSKEDDSIADVANILDTKRIKRLPVVDDHGRLLGIVSRADIVRFASEKT